jgi:AcrR family transcriptional regulator
MNEDVPKRTRGRPSTLDADKTLEVAVKAYWAEDPVDVSLNEICKRAGVSKPSLYRAFGSEDGLMRAALDRYAEQVLSGILDLLAQGGSLRATLDALIAFASRDPSMETGCLFYKMRAAKHRLGPETRARVEEIDGQVRAAFETYLQARRASGDWTSDLPTAGAARYLADQIAWALMQRAAGEDKDQIRATLTLALTVIDQP